MISIVIPLYNKENLIKRTLDSVFLQTCQDFEVIIINDGSTDNSVKEIENSFTDPRIRIVSQENSGVSTARNRGIQEANYEYIAFLDADDEWMPDYLENQKRLIEKYPSADIYASNYEFRKPDGHKRLPAINRLLFNDDTGLIENYFEIASHSDPLLWTSAVVVRKKAFNNIKFPEGIKSGEDLLTWARLASNGKIAWSKKPLAIYNLGFSNPRPPEDFDKIGASLELLFKENPDNSDIKNYIAFWYKMRMCRCLAHRMWGHSRKAFFKSISYNPLQAKIFLSIPKYIIKGK